MAVPKCKVSKARRDKRRSNVWKLEVPGLAKCPKCGEPVLPHRACKACGFYKGREVIAVIPSICENKSEHSSSEMSDVSSCILGCNADCI